jgi:hypothetical protein
MGKKTKIVAVLVISTFILYFGFTLVKADNPVGKYISIKGGELEEVEEGHWATYQAPISDLNLAWARIHLRWNRVDELGSGDFDFTTDPEYISFRDAVMIADSMGAKVIVTIKGAPEQLIEPTPIATAPNGTPTPWPVPCGRISTPQGVDRLKLFTVALLQQLRSDFGLGPNDPPPVEYIEIWNEPDAPAYDAVPDYYGCWVKKQNGTPEYQDGGIYYAQVLNAVAPYVKSQFPPGSVKFVAGATMNSTNGFLEEVVDPQRQLELLS